MIWVLLFNLLFNMDDTGSYLLSPNAQKMIKTTIKDEGRRKSAIETLKYFEGERKSIGKKEKNLTKVFLEMMSSQRSTQLQFNLLLEDIMELKSSRHTEYTSSIIKISEQIEEEEWQEIILKIDNDFEEIVAKRTKMFKKLNKNAGQVQKKLVSQIKDESRKSEVNCLLRDYLNLSNKYQAELLEHKYVGNDLFKKREACTKDYEKVQEQNLQIWKDYLQLQISTHQKLAQLTTEKEWRIFKQSSKKYILL